jgi:nitrate reductase NapD
MIRGLPRVNRGGGSLGWDGLVVSDFLDFGQGFYYSRQPESGQAEFRRYRMNISGISVSTRPEWVESVAQSLSAIEGVEVHAADVRAGKLVVTLEAPTVSAEVEGFKRIRALPHVVAADLVQHYFEEDGEIIHAIPDDLDTLEGVSVPDALKDH